MIVAALAALPLIEQVGQGLATSVANTVSNMFGSNSATTSGQNVPSSGASSSATSAQPSPAAALSNDVTNALLQLQESSNAGHAHGHRHHHGAGNYKAASDLTSQLTSATGSSGTPVAPPTAVTA